MSTYTPIATQTLSTATATVTFDGIPQTYTDLVLVCNVAQSSGANSLRYRFNDDSDSNYSATHLYGNGSTASSGRESSATSGYINTTGSTTLEAVFTLQVMNYSNITTNKTAIGRGNNASVGTDATVGLWRDTSAINKISVAMGGSFPTNNFASGSTFTLYGIGSGSPKAFGGDEVRTDGTYWYHIYRSSGIFAPMQDLTGVDCLVVAGGGGGARSVATDAAGGGGGAGGFRTTTSTFTLGNNYTITVGAGGNGRTSTAGVGTSGSNSSISGSGFSTFSATGGGGGGYERTDGGNGTGVGLRGGSAGGNGRSATVPLGNLGGYSPSEGSNGGAENGGANGGGGGGASAAGGTQTGVSPTLVSGVGGAGTASSITGTSVTYAGGGGGGAYVNFTSAAGAGGAGGGGNGGRAAAGGNGTANLGGGGGGGSSGGSSGDVYNGGNGGSGIIVLRYAV